MSDVEYEKIAARFSGDGVYGDPGDTAVVSAGVGLQVTIRPGVYASVRGHAWTSGTVAVNLPIAANASSFARVDQVVLRLDRSDWTVRAVVKQGVPGVPWNGLLTQDTGDTGVYEIMLATVSVPASATSVTVTRFEQYVGTRVRPCTSKTLPLAPVPGEHAFETDTAVLRMWTGSAWAVLYQDTGEIGLGSGYDTWQSAAANVGRLRNGIVTLRIAKTRIKSPLAVTDTDGSLVATVPRDLRPLSPNHFFGAQFSGGHAARVEVRVDGGIWVKAVSETVPVNNDLLLTMTYIRW
ncbi:hypothetical protein [Streptomyces longwoodensis]|uniref:hypothetical protein n=1 Tax=Streptomyces longwoodensis TaxID=68231 RepID=UPI0033F3198D